LPPISYEHYRDLKTGKYAPFVDTVVPYCLGDSFDADGKLFRVVATTPELFEKLKYDGTSSYEFAAGENFKSDRFYEAVIGSIVASQGRLKVGDTFNPTHGLSRDGDKHQDFKVVGVLKPTGTANDRALFANMEGFFLLEGHALAPAAEDPESQDSETANTPREPLGPTIGYDNDGNPVEPLPEAQREVTAMLVLAKDSTNAMVLSSSIQKGVDRSIQAVPPSSVVTQLLDKFFAPVRVILLVLTSLIVIVAAIGILVSIYNSMAERKHDIAVMRALGASRWAVQTIVLLESVLLAFLGGLAGIVLGHVMVGLASPLVESRTGVVLDALVFDRLELWLVAAVVLLATIAGFVPAWTAYNTDVAEALDGAR
jgi:putative ABC transport system permease protein